MTNQKTNDTSKPTELPDIDLDQIQGGYRNIAGLDQKAEKSTKRADDRKQGDKSILAESGNGSI